jgi:hypothetical protein
MQSLWGKVLAGEIRKPGSFKLKTLQALSVLEAYEAKLIHDAMSFVIDEKFVFLGENYSNIKLQDVFELDSIGVLQFSGGTIGVELEIAGHGSLSIGRNHLLSITTDKAQKIIVKKVARLTPFGRDLYSLAAPNSQAEVLAEDLTKALSGYGLTIELKKLGTENADGSRTIIETKLLTR